MEPLITLNINKIIDQLATNCTNYGELSVKVEWLSTRNKELIDETCKLRNELSALKEELKTTEGAYQWQCKEADKYKALYEGLTKDKEAE